MVFLVQREEQLARLIDEFRNCKERSQGHVVLVSGAVGSGKTGLLEQFSEQIDGEACDILRATGSPAERDLPLGLVGQLFRSASTLTADAGDGANGPLSRAGLPPRSALSGGTEAASPLVEESREAEAQALLASLLEPGGTSPLVITVDDIQHADPASLYCLQYLVRRIRREPVLVVITESPMLRPTHRLFQAELLSLPCFSRVTLPPLTGTSLLRMADESPDPASARLLAERVGDMTGGSPLLARALLDDPHTSLNETALPAVPAGEDAFAHAVLRCLYRHEPAVRRVAQALAVLERPTQPGTLEEILCLTPKFAAHAVQILQSSGLAGANALRHPRISRAILDDIPAGEFQELHRRAAEVLYHHGDEPSAVAHHLVKGDHAETGWTGPVLEEAAGHALSTGRPDRAADFLRLAKRSVTGQDSRVRLNQMLVAADWQINPLAAKVHLTELIGTPGDKAGRAWEVLPAVPYLLWQGLGGQAREILARVAAECPPDPEDAARAHFMRQIASFTHPGLIPDGCETSQFWPPSDIAVLTGRGLETFSVLMAVTRPGGEEQAVPAAEHLLQRYSAEAGAVGQLVPLLVALLLAGRPDRVVFWSETLTAQPRTCHAPTWTAVLHALRAEAARRLGHLREATRYAQRALKEITPQAWGVAVAIPLATLIMCAEESDDPDEMAALLRRPLPPQTFETPFGLFYLAARARYHLVTDHPKSALADLGQCADLMREWRLEEAVGLVAWRVETAQAHMRQGNHAQAARLLREQLDAPWPLDGRTRGRALRLLAKTVSPNQRGALLSEAVVQLQAVGVGDTLELSRALVDLAATLRQDEEPSRCRLLLNRGHELAQDSGADALAQRIRESMVERFSAIPSSTPSSRQADESLSRAERRVGALAAQGMSNRQISSKLFITVSTVEQHLTRIYRKLDVKRRDRLPAELAAYMELDPVLSNGHGSRRDRNAK